MKVNILEAHDRLLHFKKTQSDVISQGVDDCLKKNPLSLALQERSSYIYVYGHVRTLGLDEKYKYFNSGKYATLADVPEKRILWSARLTKPRAEPNTYLFRVQSKTDVLEICWILPPQEMWGQFEKGNVTESDMVQWSINEFNRNKNQLEENFPDDLKPRDIRRIYGEIIGEMKGKKEMLKPVSLVASSTFSTRPDSPQEDKGP